MKITPSLRTRGDARLLGVVLDNLLGNALKFTGGRGRATIEVGMSVEAGEAVVWARGEVGRGATFSFTLGTRERREDGGP